MLREECMTLEVSNHLDSLMELLSLPINSASASLRYIGRAPLKVRASGLFCLTFKKSLLIGMTCHI